MKQINVLPKASPLRLPRLNDIIPTLLLILVSRSNAMGMYPFAIAFFAAAYNKRVAYIGIIGACVGIISSAGVWAVPKYFLMLLAYWLFTMIYKSTSISFKSAVTGICSLIGGGAMLLINYKGMFDVFFIITESITAALMYIIFSKASSVTEDFHRRRGMSSEDYLCMTITAGVVLSGLFGIGFKGIGVTQILVSYLLLHTALNSSVATAACTGICLGFISSMSQTGAVIMMGVYGFGTLFSSFMNNMKKPGCFIGYVCAMSVMLIYTSNLYKIPAGVLNPIIGGLMFLATPRTVDEYFRSFFTKSIQVEAVSPAQRMREYLYMRLKGAGEAFESLHESFFSISEGRLKKYSDDLGTILDETAERVCAGCKMCGKCWQTDFRRTYKNSLELIGIIEHEGKLTEENMPVAFAEKCHRPKRFIYEINHVYELFKRDILRRGDATNTRNLISEQYRELNRLFSAMADDINEGFEFLEEQEERIVNSLDKLGIIPYEVSAVEGAGGICEIYLRLPPAVNHSIIEGVISNIMGRSVVYEKTERGLSKYTTGALYAVKSSLLQLPKDGCGVNGDSVTMFTVGGSKFYCIIADGMGSGNEAQYESAAACRLLTGFLKSGFSVKTALGILNSSMCINMENEIYTTIDLLCIDLYTAEAYMYKIGSAQTVLLNGGEFKILSSTSVPAGILSDIRLDKKTVMLKEGDLILMMSDGITEAGNSISKTDWIKKIMAKPFEDTDSLAKSVMDTALMKNNGAARDDMSVVALEILSK